MAKSISKIQKDIMISFLLRLATMLCGVIVIPIMTNLTDKQSLGIWFTILGLLQWISMMDLGLSAGVRNRIATLRANHEDSLTIFRCIVCSFYTLGLILLSIGLCLTIMIYVFPIKYIFSSGMIEGIEQVRTILVLSSWTVIINLLLSLSIQVLAAYEMPVFFSLAPFLSSVLYFLWVFIAKEVGLSGVFILVSGYLITLSISGLVIFRNMYVLVPTFPLKIKYFVFDFSLVKGFALKLFIVQACAIIISTLPKVLISHKLSPSLVVDYEIAQKVVMFGVVFFTIILNSFWSSFTIAWHSNDMMWINKTFKKLLLLMIPVVGGGFIYFLSAKFIIGLWMGEQYVSDSTLYFAFSIYFIITCWTNIYGSFLNSISDTQVQTITTLISMVIIIPVSIVLIAYFNVGGAVLGMCVAMLPFCICGPIHVKKIIRDKILLT